MVSKSVIFNGLTKAIPFIFSIKMKMVQVFKILDEFCKYVVSGAKKFLNFLKNSIEKIKNIFVSKSNKNFEVDNFLKSNNSKNIQPLAIMNKSNANNEILDKKRKLYRKKKLLLIKMKLKLIFCKKKYIKLLQDQNEGMSEALNDINCELNTDKSRFN